ncbi:hypothetical protein N2152v2_002754 [Parachlorella kessleri]
MVLQGITNDSSPAGPSKRSGSSETLGEVRSSSGSGGRVVVRQTLEAVEKEAAGEATEEGLEWSDPLAAVRHSPGVKTWRTLTEFVQNCDAPLPTAQQQQEPYLRLGAASSDSVEELLSLGPVQPGVGRNLGQVLHALHIVTWAEGNLSRLSLGELEEMPEFACKARPTHQAGASSQEGRAKRIGILIISSGEPCYAKLSEANKVSYAQRHGYGIHILPPPDPSRHPSWSKVPAVLSLLPLYDWMWVVDTDTLVMTPSVPLTDFIDDDYDLVMTRDCNAVNGGSWLVRNSQWTEALLAQLYARHKAVPSCWWEQSAFIQLTALPGVRERIKVLPNKGLNSYGEGICGDKAAFTKGDLLVHFPGIANKSEVFAKYWRQLQSDADAPWPYQSSEGEGRGLATWFSHLLPTASVGHGGRPTAYNMWGLCELIPSLVASSLDAPSWDARVARGEGQ